MRLSRLGWPLRPTGCPCHVPAPLFPTLLPNCQCRTCCPTTCSLSAFLPLPGPSQFNLTDNEYTTKKTELRNMKILNMRARGQ